MDEYPACVKCGETSRPIFGHGECRKCYMRAYREKNREKVRESQRRWYRKVGGKDYMKRKREQTWFDGNREAALLRDNHACVRCGKTAGLVVHHKDGNGRGSKNPNSELENLETLCRGCHAEEHHRVTWARGWDRCWVCFRDDRQHNAKGLCVACYSRLRHQGQLEDMVRSCSKEQESCRKRA